MTTTVQDLAELLDGRGKALRVFLDQRGRVHPPEGGRQMTKQSDLGDTDINVIVKRARALGGLPPGRAVPRYGDFTNRPTFHEALSQVRQAEADFMELPARVRQLCSNDVGVFLDMVHDDEQRELLLEAGLDGGRIPTSAQPAEPEPSPTPAPEPTPTP